MTEEDYEEYDDEEEESEPLMLTIDENGKATIRKPEDYVEVLKTEAELIKKFIDENKKLFEDFVKREGAD